MKLLQRLPGSRREPHGLEWAVLRRMPTVLLAGTVLPPAYALAYRLFATATSPDELAKLVQLNDFLALGLVLVHWTVVFTVTLFCIIVTLMKGPAYVADRYDLPDDHERD